MTPTVVATDVADTDGTDDSMNQPGSTISQQKFTTDEPARTCQSSEHNGNPTSTHTETPPTGEHNAGYNIALPDTQLRLLTPPCAVHGLTCLPVSYLAYEPPSNTQLLLASDTMVPGDKPITEERKDMFRHVLLNQTSACTGYKRFGNVAKEATCKEFKQLIDKDVFTPVQASMITHQGGVQTIPLRCEPHQREM